VSGRLVFPGAVPPSSLLSATNQAGPRTGGMVPSAGNTGGMTFAASGTPVGVVTPRVVVRPGGNLQAAGYTPYDGATLYGRLTDPAWDNGALGGANTSRLILSTGANDCVSTPVAIDSNGDGVPDLVLIAISNSTAGTVTLYSTSDFSGISAWTLRSTICSSDGEYCGSLIVSGQTVWAIYMAADDDVQVKKSLDAGLTWGSAIEIAATTYQQVPRGILLMSGRLAVTYIEDDADTYTQSHIHVRTSSNGSTWSAAKEVHAEVNTSFNSPSLFQKIGGRVVCVYYDVTGASVVGRQIDSGDPATDGTWADYAETIQSGPEAIFMPNACLAPDGTVFIVTRDSTSTDFISYKVLKGSGSFPVAVEVINTAEDLTLPAVANIGGAIWCAYIDSTNSDVRLVMTKYITAWSANTDVSWTGTGPQYFRAGIFLTATGSGAEENDEFTSTTVYDYSAGRMLALRPSHPSKSIAAWANNAWNCVFDLTTSVRVPINTICAFGNVEHLHFQMNATDSWGSPSVNTTLSFARLTIANGGYTCAVGKVTRNSGTFVPGRHAGESLRIGTLTAPGCMLRIRDNDTTTLYVDDDITAATGDLVIYSNRAWVAQTAAAYRCLRVSIDAQYTCEGEYQLPVLLLGMSHDLALYQRASLRSILPAETLYSRGGNIYRSCPGESRKLQVLSLLRPSLATYQELYARFKSLRQKPFAYIPDTTDNFDWSLMYPKEEIRWSAIKTDIEMEESV